MTWGLSRYLNFIFNYNFTIVAIFDCKTNTDIPGLNPHQCKTRTTSF